jgi:integrase
VKRSNGEGSLYQRANGLYQFRLRVEGGRVTAYGKTKAEAKRRAMDKARARGEVRTTATVADLVMEWSKLPPAESGLRPSTRDQYLSLLNSHVVPAIGTTRLDAVTKRKVAEVVRGFDGAWSTKRSSYAALVKLLDHAVSHGLLGVNVAGEVPRPARAESKERGISREQAVAVLNAANGHRWEVAAWLGFGCGLRRGEILALRWSDVDLKHGLASINGNVTRTSQGLVRGATKTKRGNRQVPIPASVRTKLKAHKKRQTADRLRAGVAWADSGHVLVNEAGGLVEPRALSKAWRSWAKRAGVEDTGTHVGRHYAAATLVASGEASIPDAAAMLGHDPAVLTNTYAVAVMAAQRAASDALGDSLRVRR